MEIAVKTHNLSKQYKTTLAVNDLNIEVPAGVRCGFLGKNGAGKTTTLRMLAGLLRPTRGEISIMGMQREYGQHGSLPFGYLPDVPNFYAYMSGYEFLLLCGRLLKIPENKLKQHAAGLLEKVGLERDAGRISTYSRGMKQRLGIAQALLNDPPVIFMDEPISALDPVGRKDIAQIVRSLDKTTVIFSTHILSDIEHICDYVLIIEHGRILEQAALRDLQRKYAANTCRVVFYDGADAQTFCEKAAAPGYDIVRSDAAVSIKAAGMDAQALSKKITEILHAANLAAESFGLQAPGLEDIFHEVIKNA